ncbi:MAG: J domain-containing protein [Bdellovibrionota bacterium]|jgi:curved DNA-binding protein CbpA
MQFYSTSVQEAFATLGLGSEASFEEVKKRYRSLLKKYHPDKFALDEKKRKAAEDKTIALNNAMDDLENYFKDSKAQQSSRSYAGSTSSTTSYSGNRGRQRTQNEYSDEGETRRGSYENYSYNIFEDGGSASGRRYYGRAKNPETAYEEFEEIRNRERQWWGRRGCLHALLFAEYGCNWFSNLVIRIIYIIITFIILYIRYQIDEW